MKKEIFKFPSKLKGHSIHAVIIKPETEVIGLVQIIHGFAEHIGRYEAFMSFLAKEGYLVFGDDHLGHGLTAKSAEDLSDVGSYQALEPILEDEKELNNIVRSRYPSDLPCIILGHSMGSLILRALLGKYPDLCDKAIIMGTSDMPPLLLKIFGAILNLYKIFRPGDYRSKTINYLGIGKYNNSFKNTQTINDWLAKNPENIERYNKDKLCGAPGSLHTFYFLRQIMALIRDDSHLAKMNQELPVLFASGQQDAFGDFGKGVCKVKQLFKDAGMKEISCKLYPEMRHEILNEKNADLVYLDILNFIKT